MNINAFGEWGYFAFIVAFFAILIGGVSWNSRNRRRAARRAMDEEGYPFLSGGSNAPTPDELHWDDAVEKGADDTDAGSAEEPRRRAG